ncbi:MAG: AI-2E family transporter [Bacteroidia bacterium]|nr:AI-2E family transporter [Bacteroidia bacterium]
MTDKISLKELNRFLFFTIMVVAALYFGRPVLVPFTFSVFFATLFTRMSNKLEDKGWKRVYTALVSITILIATTIGIIWLVVWQAQKLGEDLPAIEKKAEAFIQHAQEYIGDRLDIPKAKQKDLIENKLKSAAETSGKVIKNFFAGMVGLFGSAVMALIFAFLFLYQREKYERFFIGLFKQSPPGHTREVLQKISTVSQSYLTGRVLSIIIFTILFTSGFLIIGLKNAFLLAFIAALLTIIPYVGSIVGGLFPFAVALVTEDSLNVAVGALAVILIIQGIDNYFIEPYIIGGEVNISAFFTIFILLIGGLIWGVAGMILFLPMLGVAKIIFDNVPGLEIYGELVGDQKKGKGSGRISEKLKGLFKRKRND